MDAWEKLRSMSTAPPGSDAWEVLHQQRVGDIMSDGIQVIVTDTIDVAITDEPILVHVNDNSIHVVVDDTE